MGLFCSKFIDINRLGEVYYLAQGLHKLMKVTILIFKASFHWIQNFHQLQNMDIFPMSCHLNVANVAEVKSRGVEKRMISLMNRRPFN